MIDHGGIFRAFHDGFRGVPDDTIHHNTGFTVGLIAFCIIDQAVTVVDDRIVDEDVGITFHEHVSRIARICRGRIFFQDLGAFHDQRADLNGRAFIDVQHIARTDREGGESARCFHTPALHIHIFLRTFQPVFKTGTVELQLSERIFHVPVNHHILVTDDLTVFNDRLFLGAVFRCQEDIAGKFTVPGAGRRIVRTACSVLVIDRVEVVAAEGIDTGGKRNERIFVDAIVHFAVRDLYLNTVPICQRGGTEGQHTVVVNVEVVLTGLLDDLRDRIGIKHFVNIQTVVGIHAGFLTGNDFLTLDHNLARERVSIFVDTFPHNDICGIPDIDIHAVRAGVAEDDAVQNRNHRIGIFHHNTTACTGSLV